MSSAADAPRPPDIGFVLYRKGDVPGTLNARTYTSIRIGYGVATGGPDEGFAGRYQIRYSLENGEFSSEFDLVIKKQGELYDVSWLTDRKLIATGVGMEIDHALAVGWRRIAD